jgi:hypothetical protein
VRSRGWITKLAARALVVSLPFIGLLAGPARAQELQITPNVDVTPTSATTPWIVYMAIAAAVLGVLILLALLSGYMRFGPKFFGREAAPGPLRPGQRPPELARQAAAMRPAVPAPASTPAPAPATPAPARAAAPSAVAVAERPVSAPSTDAPTAEASTISTAGPGGEPAVQADAVGEAEAAAPEPRPTAKTEEEVGSAPAAQAPPAPAQQAAAPAAASHGSGALDQETFDRVLQEQLDKGVDRRVAEGRARAAAVVAARKKESG